MENNYISRQFLHIKGHALELKDGIIIILIGDHPFNLGGGGGGEVVEGAMSLFFFFFQ